MTKNIIDKYFKAKTELMQYFDLIPDWIEYPLDDCREMYWQLNNTEINFSEDKEKIIEMIGNQYQDDLCTKEYYQFWTKYWLHIQNTEADSYFKDEIYTHRFYPKWVYRGKDFTLIFCDPHVDGCKWWRIFDNKKEIKNDD